MSYGPFFFFFFNDTATTEIYTLSLHDALPISHVLVKMVFTAVTLALMFMAGRRFLPAAGHVQVLSFTLADRKSTRLNSSHVEISYAVFCLKKKKKKTKRQQVSSKHKNTKSSR